MRYVLSESSMNGTGSEIDRSTCPRTARTRTFTGHPQVTDYVDAHLVSY